MKLLAIFAAAGLLASALGAQAGPAEDCTQGEDPQLSIQGCTTLINAGQLNSEGMAIAHNNRGNAYQRLNDPQQALQEYDRAINLNPNYSTAYNNRAVSNCMVGNINGAIADFTRAASSDARLAKQLQGFMQRRGHYKGALDGAFGPASKAALSAMINADCRG
ncbi:MAG: tetratricopeptide repeat protein [Pseudomonadota bacterium]